MEIPHVRVTFGADPELFVARNGQVIGAEKVLPTEGLPTEGGKIIIDGVQAELNPVPSHCRESFSMNLQRCFRALQEQLENNGATADFSQAVTVTAAEMVSLSKESQQFGCSPSKNVYQESKIAITDASKYYSRSAGGHIHLGGLPVLHERPKEVVQLLDILLGNTCVLLDRDAGNIKRREVYGKAGEYRTPEHGLEYRTLSNFWLRDYKLVSFVLGMARFAVNVALVPEVEKQFVEAVDMNAVQEAINTNNFDLAYENFELIQTLLSITRALGTTDLGGFPLEGNRAMAFEQFVHEGIDKYCPKDPLTYWAYFDYHEETGWESFIDSLAYDAAPKKKPRIAPIRFRVNGGIVYPDVPSR